MTTSNKNFRVKNGLEVQGTTATVNGSDIVTKASSIDDLFDVNVASKADGYSLVYNSATSKWIASPVSGGGGGGASVTISDTPPSTPSANSLWFDSSNGAMYVYYSDVDTSQWVAIKAATTVPDASRIFQSDTAPSSQDVTINDFWFNTTTGNLYIWYVNNNIGQWVSVQTDVTVAISGDLNTLSDVVTTTPSNNEALVYDSTLSKWVNKSYINAGFYTSPNYIINGGFDIWQRGASVAGGFNYTADRFMVDDAVTVTRSTDVPSQSGMAYSMLIPSTTNIGNVRQAIELPGVGIDGPFKPGSVWTFSVWAKSDASRDIRFSAAFRPGIVGTAIKTVVSAVTMGTMSSTWQRFSTTFTIPSGSISGANNLAISFGSTSGSSNNFYYTGVQLEEGSTATPFRRNSPSIQAELAACQRYYYRVVSVGDGNYTTAGTGFAQSSTQSHFYVPLPVQMRSLATLSYSALSDWGSHRPGLTIVAASTLEIQAINGSNNLIYIYMTHASNANYGANVPTVLSARASTTAWLGFSAEL